MKLKPNSFDVCLIYNCPECGQGHWYSKEELVSCPILMCCNEVVEIEPVSEIKVHCRFDKTVPEGAIKVLADLGFPLEQIKASGIDAKSSEDFVRKFLASIDNEPTTAEAR